MRADASASAPSRLSLSRVAPSRDAVELEAPQQQPCDQRAVAEALRLCGGGETCDVVLVGCGVPKRGMGWYHGVQMLDGDVPSAKMVAVVEPWFLGKGADSPPGETFKKWADEMAAKHGTKFVKDISELDIKGPTLALISGRTADNPRLLKEVIAAGCTHVYLEKPGPRQPAHTEIPWLI